MVTCRKTHLCLPKLLVAGIFLSLTVPLCAQVTSDTTTTPKSTVGIVKLDTAQVVYTSGDDAVLKLPDGSIRLLELKPGTSLTIDGKPSTPADLTPGMTISHAQLHTRTESDVTTVTQFNGTVTKKKGRLLQLRLDDGTSKFYSVPYHATFEVNGKTTTYDDLPTGSKISVTAVKTEGLSTVSSKAAKVAETPQQSGTLVIEQKGE